MKRNFHLLFLVTVSCSVAHSRAVADETIKPLGEVAPGYFLAWSDQFDGQALDAEKWNYRTDSKMWSTQLPGNVSVASGLLSIALKKETSGGKQYTGGGVISKQTFQYGYYEARFKVPPGAGWHTSFWTQKQDGTGGTNPRAATQEIDICEQDSVKLTDYSAGVIDWSGPKKGAGFGRQHVKTPDVSADFHVWGCEFTPLKVSFYFDGKLTHQTDATKFPHGDQHIWLTSIASSLGGTTAVDDSKLPAAAIFDYVRFFRKAGDK